MEVEQKMWHDKSVSTENHKQKEKEKKENGLKKCLQKKGKY